MRNWQAEKPKPMCKSSCRMTWTPRYRKIYLYLLTHKSVQLRHGAQALVATKAYTSPPAEASRALPRTCCRLVVSIRPVRATKFPSDGLPASIVDVRLQLPADVARYAVAEPHGPQHGVVPLLVQ